MRELSITETQSVSGGFGFDEDDEPSVQETVVVVGQRILRSHPWTALGMSAGEYIFGPGYDQLIGGIGDIAQFSGGETCSQEAANLQGAMANLDFRELTLEGNLQNYPATGNDSAAILFWNMDNVFFIGAINEAEAMVQDATAELYHCANE